MVGGGPSVLCDAVAVLASKEGAALLANDSAAKDFVSDAFAHCKFIAYVSEVMPLFEKAGLANASMTVASRSSRTGCESLCR